jgi:hypothetical protein
VIVTSLTEARQKLKNLAYGTDLASFPGSLDGRTTVTLRPTRVVATG